MEVQQYKITLNNKYFSNELIPKDKTSLIIESENKLIFKEKLPDNIEIIDIRATKISATIKFLHDGIKGIGLHGNIDEKIFNEIYKLSALTTLAIHQTGSEKFIFDKIPSSVFILPRFHNTSFIFNDMSKCAQIDIICTNSNITNFINLEEIICPYFEIYEKPIVFNRLKYFTHDKEMTNTYEKIPELIPKSDNFSFSFPVLMKINICIHSKFFTDHNLVFLNLSNSLKKCVNLKYLSLYLTINGELDLTGLILNEFRLITLDADIKILGEARKIVYHVKYRKN